MRYDDTMRMCDGVQLAYTRYEVAEPRAVICALHGLGEHARRYDRVAEAWNSRGFSFRMLDYRGHGRSPGKRGDTPYARTAQDAMELIASGEAEGIPRVLYGHSFGGGLALHLLLSQPLPVKAAVVTSPWLRLKRPYGKAAVALLGVAAAIAPGITIPNGLSSDGLSHDEGAKAAYRDDPLVHERISLNMAYGAFRAGESSLANAATLNVPLLLMHGSDDPICDAAGSRAFAKAAGDKCVYVEYPGMLHELHNENVWEAMIGRQAEFAAREIAEALSRG